MKKKSFFNIKKFHFNIIKNIKENKNTIDILLILFIFTSILSIIIINPISNLDEIWNYNTARAVSEGLIPYKDISMITTPILPMITAIFLKLIVNELIVSRILASCVWTGILFTTYKILINLIKEKNICLIITVLLGILCRDIYCIDYNIVILLISLNILYQELKYQNKKFQINKKYDFIIRIFSRNCNVHKTKYRNNFSRNCCNI